MESGAETGVEKVSSGNFGDVVLHAGTPVLVDFSAVWCGPCKMLEPIVEQLAQDWAGKVKVVRLDVDEHPELAEQYQVMGLPTLMLFDKGKPIERVTGYQPKNRLLRKFGPLV